MEFIHKNINILSYKSIIIKMQMIPYYIKEARAVVSGSIMNIVITHGVLLYIQSVLF
jgi:hypothetical protein